MLIFAGVLGASLLAFKVFKLADRFDVDRRILKKKKHSHSYEVAPGASHNFRY